MDALFRVHKLNKAGFAKADFVANAFNDLLANLMVHLPANGREVAIVRTKLEEACFFAKKAIANDPANQLSEAEADRTQL